MTRNLLRKLATASLAIICGTTFLTEVQASFHTWDISEIYSNADGSVQFIELVNTPANGQDEFASHAISSNSETFIFPNDLSVGDATANLRLIIATPAYETAPGSVPADFNTLPANFFDPAGDTINFAAVDMVTFTNAPTNGIDSLNYTGSNGAGENVASNSPTNLTGQVGSLVPEPSSAVLFILCVMTATGFRRSR